MSDDVAGDGGDPGVDQVVADQPVQWVVDAFDGVAAVGVAQVAGCRPRWRSGGCRRGRDWVPVHVVAARLGHPDPAITLRVYAHVLPHQASEVAQVFASMVNQSVDEDDDC